MTETGKRVLNLRQGQGKLLFNLLYFHNPIALLELSVWNSETILELALFFVQLFWNVDRFHFSLSGQIKGS